MNMTEDLLTKFEVILCTIKFLIIFLNADAYPLFKLFFDAWCQKNIFNQILSSKKFKNTFESN